MNQLLLSNLIRKAKSSPEAFAKLYSLYVEATYKYLLLRCKNVTIAQDLTSQAWEAVLKSIIQLKSHHPAVFKAWLFAIVRNTFYKYLKNSSSKIEPLEDEIINSLSSEEKNPLHLAQQQDEISQLRLLIDALPEQQKEIVLMRFSAELKNKEIAKILDIDERTVASNLSRALATLRKNYEKLQ